MKPSKPATFDDYNEGLDAAVSNVTGSAKMLSWSQALAQYQQIGQAHVLVSVIATRGSIPRAVGSKMLVVGSQKVSTSIDSDFIEVKTIDTIGGGQLEYQATEEARRLLLLNGDEPITDIRQVPLGAKVAQCCGGHVTLLYEFFPSTQKHLLVFGAGHVAKALVPIVAALPMHIHWVDARRDLFPASQEANVTHYYDDEPTAIAERLMAMYGGVKLMSVILTHDHQLDFDLCKLLLKHQCFHYVGLIGSKTKAARFKHRLTGQGLSDGEMQPWVCPVGLPEVSGKLPQEVAISIAGQLVAAYQQVEAKQSHTDPKPVLAMSVG